MKNDLSIEKKRPRLARPLLDGATFVAVLSSAGLLWRQPLALTAIYAAITLFLVTSRWSAATVSYFLVGFCLGPVAEYYAVVNGAWIYSGEALLPLWLPFGWGISAIVLKSVGDVLSSFAEPYFVKRAAAPRSP